MDGGVGEECVKFSEGVLGKSSELSFGKRVAEGEAELDVGESVPPGGYFEGAASE